jgi:hypothetical protein
MFDVRAKRIVAFLMFKINGRAEMSIGGLDFVENEKVAFANDTRKRVDLDDESRMFFEINSPLYVLIECEPFFLPLCH